MTPMHTRASFDRLRPYLADIGRVAFFSFATILAASALLEWFAPGVAGNYVSPQKLVACLAIAGALSLLAPQDGLSAPKSRLAYAAMAALDVVFVFIIAWKYAERYALTPFPLALAAAGAVL